MGKSSLLVRTKQRLEAEGIVCAVIDLSYLSEKGMNATQWYAGIVKKLASCFLKKFKFSSWWREHQDIPPIQRLDQFIEQVLLRQRPEKLVIFIDEIEKVLSLNFDFDGFFATIRSWYNKRAENPEYERLNVALLGVAIPAELVKDKAKTPFNIGKAIELTPFTSKETQSLIQGLERKVDDPQRVLSDILDWTGGQPLLTQKLCNLVAQNTEEKNPDIEQLVQRQIIRNWEAQDDPQHLRTIRDRLLRDEKYAGRLLGLYQKIWSEPEVAANYNAEETELLLSGLVIRKHGKLKVYNPIYKAVFDQNWIEGELGKLRPYGEAIAAWETSDYKDESRLLRGKALEQAREWSMDKSLSDIDYKFLEASFKYEVESEKEKNQSLTKYNQKIKKQRNISLRIASSLGIASLVLLIFLVIELFSMVILRKTKVELNRLNAELNLRNELLEEKLKIEQKSKLDILYSAIKIIDESYLLKNINDNFLIKENSAIDDFIELTENILDTIHEQRKFETGYKDVRSVIFHRYGKWIAIASNEEEEIKVKVRNLENDKEIKFPSERLKESRLVDSISFSPDGDWLAIASKDGYVLWNWETDQLKEEKLEKTNNQPVYDISFPEKEGEHLAVTLRDGTIFLVNWQNNIVEDFKFNKNEKTNDILVNVSFSFDGKLLAMGSDNGQVKLMDLQSKQTKLFNEKHKGQINSISFSPKGNFLATASSDKTVNLWKLKKSGEYKFERSIKHQGVVNSVDFSPDEKYLVTASSDKLVQLWDSDMNGDGEPLKKLIGHEGQVNEVSFRFDKNQKDDNQKTELLVSYSGDNTIRQWNLKRTLIENNSFTSSIFSSKGEQLATLSNESNGIIKLWGGRESSLWDNFPSKYGEMSLWELNNEEGKQQEFPATQLDYILAFSPNGKLLVAISKNDFIVRLVNLQESSDPIELEDKHTYPVYDASFSPDGKWLATVSSDEKVILWRLNSQDKLTYNFRDYINYEAPVYKVSFSPDGKILAVGSSDDVKLSEIQADNTQPFKDKGNPFNIEPNSQTIRALSFSPNENDKLLAIALKDGTIELWNWKEKKIVKELTKQEKECKEQSIKQVTFSHNGKLIAASTDKSILVWNLQGNCLQEFKNYQGEVSDLVFSPDDKRVAIASTDNTIKVFQVEASQLERLKQVIARGCDWLNQGYFKSYPEKKLEVCEQKSAIN